MFNILCLLDRSFIWYNYIATMGDYCPAVVLLLLATFHQQLGELVDLPKALQLLFNCMEYRNMYVCTYVAI